MEILYILLHMHLKTVVNASEIQSNASNWQINDDAILQVQIRPTWSR